MLQCRTKNYTLKSNIYPCKLSKAQNAFCLCKGVLKMMAVVTAQCPSGTLLSSTAVSQQLLKDFTFVLPFPPFSLHHPLQFWGQTLKGL